MTTLKLSGNMVSISTRPEDAGHAEFARDCLAENRQLKAINAELLDAMKELAPLLDGKKFDGYRQHVSCIIAKAEGKQ